MGDRFTPRATPLPEMVTLRAGLTSSEATTRLAASGPNVLPRPPAPHAWRRLAGQLTHFFALMLWVAGVLAYVAGMPQLAVAIFVVIVVNGVFAFVQEERAEKAARGLQDLLPTGVIVRRDGISRAIDASEVVVGDLVVLSPGDRVPADIELLVADGLAADASTLTGESIPVPLTNGDQAHAGTYVASGSGEGVVFATGARTELASIARLTSAAHPPRTPLARELDRIVRTIATLALVVGAGFFGVSLLLGSPARDGFLFAVGVTVALVPEGLLPTVTLSLAMGAQRMAGRNALIRHLDAVETLGSTTFICTDKTGTLTRNQMAATRVWTPVGSVTVEGDGYEPVGSASGSPVAIDAAAKLARIALTASQGRIQQDSGGWTPMGDPMEAAIDALAQRLTGGGLVHLDPILQRHPFDPERRRESVVVDGWVYVKGAPDAVFPRCTGAGEPVGADQALAALADQGLRVLAVARRRCSSRAEADADTDERDLELLGLIGLHDPPREAVPAAIAAARKAGIKLAMVTGDHPATARAIARQIGFVVGEERVTEGRLLPADDGELGALLDHDGVIVSRVSPAEKLRIARALQQRGHVVAMTGDGVNDGPALQAADIGVAMGRSGTDVARAAADLVLLDDDFSTIIAAVEQGRATFSNIHRFLTYQVVPRGVVEVGL